jgi:hypothetical protein
MTTANCRESALSYAGSGWSIIPIRPKEKAPLVRWQEYQHRRADPEEIRRWFERWPDANIGVVTGAVSGIVVLDVDPRHGGEESLVAWEMRHGPLPVTVEAITGGGGRHLYFSPDDIAISSMVAVARGMTCGPMAGWSWCHLHCTRPATSMPGGPTEDPARSALPPYPAG